jgi:DNA replication protein DnaC
MYAGHRLILDDLGVQSTTPWVAEKLFQLLNHRFTARLPTVVTTNLDLAAFDQRIQTGTDPRPFAGARPGGRYA